MTPRLGSKVRGTRIQVQDAHQFSGGQKASDFSALNHSFLCAPGGPAAEAHSGADVEKQLAGLQAPGKVLPAANADRVCSRRSACSTATNSPCCRAET